MTVHQLRLFEVVSRHLNITRAAAELRISQPSVHQQIKSLEEFCGFRLYRKVGRGIALTPEGQRLREEAAEILARIESLERRFEAKRKAPATGSLMVGGSHVPSKALLPEHLAAFKRTNPLVHITLQTQNSRNIERAVLNSALEIAVITHASYSPRLHYLPVGRETIVLFVSARHELAGKKDLRLADIAAVPLIVHRGIRRGTGHNTAELLKRIERLGCAPTILMESNSGEAVKTAVMTGVGIGILMQAHLEKEIQKCEVTILKPRDLEEMSVRSCVIYQKGKLLSDNARTFLDLLKRKARFKETREPKGARGIDSLSV